MSDSRTAWGQEFDRNLKLSGELDDAKRLIKQLEREKVQIQMLSDANNKMVVKLQNERDGLIAHLKTIRQIFRSENLTQNETAIALQQLASVIDELPERQLNKIKAEAFKVGFYKAKEVYNCELGVCGAELQEYIDEYLNKGL
jgi:glutathionyl-hydroquinone reductase